MKENRDNDEIQRLLPARINNHKEEKDKWELQFELVTSLIETEAFPGSFIICNELKESGFYNCADLRKLKKYLANFHNTGNT